MEETMRRTTIALVVVAGIVLAGCDVGTGGTPDVIVNSGESQTGISVTGSGEVTGTPDTLTVDLGVSVLGETVAEAAAQAAEKAEAMIAALEDNGVAEEDITTTNYSIWPEYDYRGNTERLVGYRVNNTVRAKVRDVESSGDVIDAAVAAGGDGAVVSSLQFSIEDNEALVEAARQAAWDDALAKATQLAELSGQTLGAAVTITETVSAPPTPYFYGDGAMAGAEEAFETPIQPGTSSVEISLFVNFAIGG